MLTEDGSHTIYIPEMGEHYHSVHGAVQESQHIFINNGFKKAGPGKISILEIGFGTGLNALLTLLEATRDQANVYYESWEAFPIPIEEALQLNYPVMLDSDPGSFNQLHQAEWGIDVTISPNFILRKVLGDIRMFESAKEFDLVYFDAFGPDFQPELWTSEVFSSIASQMRKNARLVTYSAKGQIRRNLRDSGFSVEKAPGPPGKREITIATKN
jgi:tRNA U34 5-methylaminomethyl-2-thiouridine-forming methyltransferase MnmC